MTEKKKKILISNDDGINSVGISALAEVFSQGNYELYVVAPDRQRSASSQMVTVEHPLRAVEESIPGVTKAWAVNGTPADCVKLGISHLLPEAPDLLISGINLGTNTSASILYSGTVGAAYQGLIAGVPSIAISIADFNLKADCTATARIGKIIADKCLSKELELNGFLLNINVPKGNYEELKGIKTTKLSSAFWRDKYERHADPFGREFYWFAGEYIVPQEEALSTDDACLAEKYVSITPLKFELYNDKHIDYLNSLNLNII